MNILLGVTSSIACYKSIEIVRLLVKAGHNVRVIQTQNSKRFILPLTFQAAGAEAVFDELWQAGNGMAHIELTRWADQILIAPATANFIGKLANGIADDLLMNALLAAITPISIAPAMNHSMYNHSAIQANLHCLQNRGIILLSPAEGEQACGETGVGRMLEPAALVAAILKDQKRVLPFKRVLLTVGATREALDPVRFISNYSSGKMGAALVKAFNAYQVEIEVVKGHMEVCLPRVHGTHFADNAVAFDRIVSERIESFKPDVFIGCAAISDFIPIMSEHKIKKDQPFAPKFEPAPDILSNVGHSKKCRFVVGFAAETQALIPSAQKKLHEKHADLFIANHAEQTMGSDENAISIISKSHQESWGNAPKQQVAEQLVHSIASHYHEKHST